jgi:hypothetical protein
MGFLEDKSEIFGEVAANRSLQENFPELNKTVSLFSTTNSKKGNMIPFLLELVQEIGEDSLEEDVFKPLIKKSEKWEEDVKETVIDLILGDYAKNSNFNMSGYTNPLIVTKIKDIDIGGDLKIDEDSEIGKFYYGNKQENTLTTDANGINFNFNVAGNFPFFLKKVMKNGSGRWKELYDFTYTAQTEELKVSLVNSNINFEKLIRRSFDSVKLLDLPKLMASLLNHLFGTLNNLTDIGSDHIENFLRGSELINKIIDKETLSETEFNTYDDSFFVFTKEEQDIIREKKEAIINGTKLSNLGCGQGVNFIDFEDLSKSFDDLITYRPTLVNKSFSNFTDKLIKNATANLPEEDKKSSVIAIIIDFIKTLPSIIVQHIISNPIVSIIIKFCENGVNGINIPIKDPTSGLEKGGFEEFIIKFRSKVICIVKKVYCLIVGYIYEIIKNRILNLVAFKITKITAEKSLLYAEQARRARELLKGINNILTIANG